MADNQTPPNRGKEPKREPDDKFEWKKAAKTMSFWMLIILIVIVVSTYLTPREHEADVIDYSDYRSLIKQELLDSAVITDRELVGKLKSPDAQGRMEFKTILGPITEEMIAEWEAQEIKIEFKERATNWMAMILTSILPWIILIGLWIFFMRRMSGGGNRGIFSFGKSKAKLIPENTHKVTFADVAGGEEAKEELQEIIQFLKEPKKFQRLGGRIPKGALLVGPPGTGKTLMARAVAGEAGVPFYSMSGADFVEMFVGVGASRVRDLFEQGKRNAPCIIFIDEIDAVGRQRGAGLGGGHDEREQTLNQLLVEMDGFEFNEGVILLAATNRPDVLDPALLRPGRFDRQIVVDRPDVRGREGILKVHSRNVPLGRDVNLKTLAKGTPGLSGADLANLVNEAALLGARRDAKKVQMIDFENAKDKVMMGTERRSMLISDEEKKLTAYHESGHVLVAKLIPGSDPVHKVTIIPRGRALGVTHYLPIDEKHSWSKKYIEDKMVHLMGGRAAERLIFNDYTNGAAQDIKQATEIARRMVCDWGMSEKIGPLALGGKSEEIFIGRDFGHQKDYSEATAIEIDREIKKLVMKAMNTAIDLLNNNMDKLHLLTNALLEREILDGPEIDLVLDGKKLPKAKKRNPKPRRRKSTGRRPRRSTVVKTARDGVDRPVDRSADKVDNSDRIKAVENALNLIDKDEKPKEKPKDKPKQGRRPQQGRRPSTGGNRGRRPNTPKPETKAPDKKPPVTKPPVIKPPAIKPEDKKTEE